MQENHTCILCIDVSHGFRKLKNITGTPPPPSPQKNPLKRKKKLKQLPWMQAVQCTQAADL